MNISVRRIITRNSNRISPLWFFLLVMSTHLLLDTSLFVHSQIEKDWLNVVGSKRAKVIVISNNRTDDSSVFDPFFYHANNMKCTCSFSHSFSTTLIFFISDLPPPLDLRLGSLTFKTGFAFWHSISHMTQFLKCHW